MRRELAVAMLILNTAISDDAFAPLAVNHRLKKQRAPSGRRPNAAARLVAFACGAVGETNRSRDGRVKSSSRARWRALARTNVERFRFSLSLSRSTRTFSHSLSFEQIGCFKKKHRERFIKFSRETEEDRACSQNEVLLAHPL